MEWSEIGLGALDLVRRFGGGIGIWLLGGSLAGGLFGLALTGLLFLRLRSVDRRREARGLEVSPAGRRFLLLLWLFLLPLCLAVTGGLVGTAEGARRVLLLPEVAATLTGAAIETVAQAPGAASGTESSELLQRFLSRREEFSIVGLQEQWQAVSRDTLGRAASALSSMARPETDERGDIDAPLRTRFSLLAAERLMRFLEQRKEGAESEWLEPVVAELGERDAAGDGNGRTSGREIATVIALVHVLSPLSGLVFWSLALQAVPIVLLALALVVVPLGIRWLLRRGAATREASTAPDLR